MSPDGRLGPEVEALRRRAALARERAAWCAEQAARHEAQSAAAGQPQRAWHERFRDLHRRAEVRHIVSAELHDLLAARQEAWRDRSRPCAQPALMGAVAARLGAASAVAALIGARSTVAAVAASDATARTAYDLELVMAEGPATEAARGGLVMAAGPAILERWSRYGPAVTELGIHAVCAVQLGPPQASLGALCAYDIESGNVPRSTAVACRLMADALTQMVLGAANPADPEDVSPNWVFPGGSGDQSVVHQAAGMVSVQFGCGVDDAADLLAARAFADATPLREIARQVVQGEALFG